MVSAKITKYSFIGLLLVLLYLTFKVAQPFLMYICLGIIFTIALYPVYGWFCKVLKNKSMSSLITILLVLLIIIIPTSTIIGILTVQTKNIINSVDINQVFNQEHFGKVNDYMVNTFGVQANLRQKISDIIGSMGDVAGYALKIVGSVFDTVLGLFVMFFVMYYGFTEGNEWAKKTRGVLPLDDERKNKLVKQIKDVTKAVIYGDLLIALLQGLLGGIGLFLIGVPNAVFWGFVMTILAFLPVIGTGLVWIPVGIIELINHDVVGGIFILVYGVIVILGVDYLLRPELVSGKARIHPVVALIGILGGLRLFGVFGIVLGPVIAALFITMTGFFYQDYIQKKNKEEKSQKSRKNKRAA